MNQDQLYAVRHSLAHIMATAIMRLYPEAKLGVGPVVENGFYYDIDLGDKKISTDNFGKIEKEMRKIITEDQPFVRSEKNINEALDWAQAANQPYKAELLNDLKRSGTTIVKELDVSELGLATEGDAAVENVSFYTNGDFADLCRGPHMESTGQVGAFKLMRVAGAYWRGKETNPQMQRLYGVAFATQEELDQYLLMLEEAKKRDHRKLGQDLGIFMFTDAVGAGLPLWLPNGERLKHTLIEYMREQEEAQGYQYVSTPVLAHESLYQRSGHAQYYAEDMYHLDDDEGNRFYIKAMSCPHHHMIYEKMVTSYRDLPFRLAEAGTVYRNELSGTLTGLIRVRGAITQNDAHIYVMPEQLKAEFLKVLQLFKVVYEHMGITGYWYRLSLPDFSKDKFAGERQQWEQASQLIREALRESGVEFVEAEGEAAFYGPKLDVQIRNVLGKEDSIATNQVDILVPERMGLTYTDSQGNQQYPIIIHRAILGSFERFIGFLLEKTAGRLPVWLAPEQLRVATVNQQEETIQFAERIVQQAKEQGIFVTIDNDNESVGKKIRAAELMKVPYMLVIGEKEVANGKVLPRVRRDLKQLDEDMTPDNLMALLTAQIKNRE